MKKRAVGYARVPNPDQQGAATEKDVPILHKREFFEIKRPYLI